MSLQVQGNSDSYSLFDKKGKPAEDNQNYENDWDRQHAARYGANAPIWTVAAGGGYAE